MRYLIRFVVFFPFRPSPFRVLVWLLRSMRVIPPKVTTSALPPHHILVVNFTDFVGDTVMMMPLLDRLHAVLPSATIDVATSASMSAYLREIPFIRKVISLHKDKRRIPVWSTYRRLARMIRLVRTETSQTSYDLCLLPRWGTDPEMSSFFASMTGAAEIVGHDPIEEIDTRDPFPGSSLLFSKVSRGGKGLPEAIRELRLIEACGIVDHLDVITEESRPIAALSLIANSVSLHQLNARLDIADTVYMVLAPGASTAIKRWAPERFAEVAKYVQEQLGLQVLIIGGPTDVEFGKIIEGHLGTSCRNLISRTNLSETTALLSQAALLLANDSGPAHIGAGLGVPTLILSSSPSTCTREVLNSPLRFRPVGPQILIVQPQHAAAACGDRCLEPTAHCILGIAVDEVRQHATQMLKRYTISCDNSRQPTSL